VLRLLGKDGVCVIDDFGLEAARMAVQSDVLIFLSPVTSGGYSSELKKAVDWFARSLLLPYATAAAFEVGYESPSQFTREYNRLFGAPPLRDITNLRLTAPPKEVSLNIHAIEGRI
jgi:AraC-like DNA-binding protein